jgi:glycosyltransferase involved in cell wall biosynthesis
LISQAREIWFVNDRIRDWHRQHYPTGADRMHTVTNGYDPEFVALGTGRAPDPERSLRFGYLGTISTKVPLAEFIDGWRVARVEAPLTDATAVIHGHLGHYQAATAAVAAALESGSDCGVSYAGPLAKADVASFYSSVDVLLLILGTGRYVTSGKVFEYLATGLPIVSVHDPQNAATTVLEEYPLWFPAASLASADIAAALLAAATARQSATAPSAEALQVAERFSRQRQLQPRVQALLAMATGGSDEVNP